MCIFVNRVYKVSNTKILVSPMHGNRQLTVYENTVHSQQGSVMILPVPNGGQIQLLNLFQDWSNNALWNACEKYFPQDPVFDSAFAFGGGFGATTKSRTLQVQRIGSYDCSIATNLQDLARLNLKVFEVPKNIQDTLTQHYGNGFGFVICKFVGSPHVSGHPIAYTSSLMANGAMFIPTRHEHGENMQDIQAEEKQSIHKGFVCDGCKMNPIVGTRWQSVTNPHGSLYQLSRRSTLDLCDACHSNPNCTLGRKKPFVELKVPIEEYSKEFASLEQEGPDLFDHTIYIFNATLLALPKRYTACTDGLNQVTTHDQKRQVTIENDLLQQKIEKCQKIVVRGNFENDDYMAFPLV